MRKRERINKLLSKLREETEEFSDIAYERCETVKMDAFIHYPSEMSGFNDYKRLLDIIEALQDTATEMSTALYSLKEELGHEDAG